MFVVKYVHPELVDSFLRDDPGRSVFTRDSDAFKDEGALIGTTLNINTATRYRTAADAVPYVTQFTAGVRSQGTTLGKFILVPVRS